MSPEQAKWLVKSTAYRPPSRIVCAARRNAKGEVICAPRHFDDLMQEQIARVANPDDWSDDEQVEMGFVDQFCQFFTRTEAWVVAAAAGQIAHRCGGDKANGGTLYSENLY